MVSDSDIKNPEVREETIWEALRQKMVLEGFLSER